MRGRSGDPEVRQQVEGMLSEVGRLPHVGAVESPYAAQGASQVAEDGSVAFATVTFDQEGNRASEFRRQQTSFRSPSRRRATPCRSSSVGMRSETTTPKAPAACRFGMAAALLVLLVVFGSLLAAALPLITAGLALVTGVAVMGLLSNVFTMPDFSSELALLIGLGVGVDYALFIVTRYRQGLMRGLSSEEAAVQSLDTSGRAVLFAGITVCIALLGMLALGISLLSGAGIASSVVVAFTVLAAVTSAACAAGLLWSSHAYPTGAASSGGGGGDDERRVPGLDTLGWRCCGSVRCCSQVSPRC